MTYYPTDEEIKDLEAIELADLMRESEPQDCQSRYDRYCTERNV